MKNELYPDAEKSYARQIEKIEKNKEIIDSNKKHVLGFMVRCQGAGISTLRLTFYANRLRQIAELIGETDFKEATREDIEKVMAALESRNYKAHTLDAFIVSIKAFYRWLYDLDRTEALPKPVRWIQRKRPPNTLKKEDLLTDDEVNRMIRVIDDPMKRALLAVLYEGAMRPEELRGIKVGDVHFNGDKVKMYVRGKMQKKQGDRIVFLARSYGLLKVWLDCHPEKNNPEAWLWPNRGGGPLTAPNLKKTIQRTRKLARIEKRVWAYLFRHTTGTYLYRTLPTSLARKLMGHAPDSRMERVYCHLAEEDVEDAVNQLYGQEKKGVDAKKGVCVKCKGVLQLGDGCCTKCGLAENNVKAMEQDLERKTTDQVMGILMEDPAIKERISEMRDSIRQRLFESGHLHSNRK